jgi:hypothetical protein
MTKPRTLILAIGTTAIAFAVALGSVMSGASLDASSGSSSGDGKARQIALAAAPLEHATPSR